MFLVKLWIFELDFTTILSFLIGILFGVILVFLIYALICVASIGSKKFIVKKQGEGYQLDEVKELIVKAQEEFKDRSLRKDTPKFNYCVRICKDLAYGIAASYYPNSKYPLLELSINEITMLLEYIRKRMEEILDRRALRLFRKFKVSTIVDMSVKGNKLVTSKGFQVGKDVNRVLNTAKKVINILNPAWWTRKLIMDNTVNIILNKLYIVAIAVVGEETYKIYSKKALNVDAKIDTNVEEILSSIDSDIDADIADISDIENEVIDTILDEKMSFKMKPYHASKLDNNYESIFKENMPLMDKGEWDEEKKYIIWWQWKIPNSSGL